jgi:hypothetical protein
VDEVAIHEPAKRVTPEDMSYSPDKL